MDALGSIENDATSLILLVEVKRNELHDFFSLFFIYVSAIPITPCLLLILLFQISLLANQLSQSDRCDSHRL